MEGARTEGTPFHLAGRIAGRCRRNQHLRRRFRSEVLAVEGFQMSQPFTWMVKPVICIVAGLSLLLPSLAPAGLRGDQESKVPETNSPAEVAFEKEFSDPALKERLQDSTWVFQDGKRFTLHADGSTSASWHSRKGVWRIIGKNRLQLTITWKLEAPGIVSVESDASVVRWSDEEWGKLAKRVEGKLKAH